MKLTLSFLFFINYSILLTSCSVTKQLSRQSNTILLNDSAISTGHIGISIYEPVTNKYWYNYNAAHYFIPASNTKLFTLYAGMKYLGDSLVGAKYYRNGSLLFIQPNGDPTFLHPDFSFQPLFELIKNNKGTVITDGHTTTLKKYGRGWNFDDYIYSYMPERNRFPIFGNLLTISKKPVFAHFPLNDTTISKKIVSGNFSYWVTPKIFAEQLKDETKYFSKIKITRAVDANYFTIENDSLGGERLDINTIPFATRNGVTASEILSSILKKEVINGEACTPTTQKEIILYSQPSDSLFKPMMHRSDNFFAEQTLLMASNQKLGYMSDADMIDYIIKSDLLDIPQRPKWVDGSGLSRYNLFTPLSLVYLLNKMKKEFNWERLTTILATGGEGTISNYYKMDSGFIYAKTGTLSNNCALSGFLITRKGKLLIFSILANNYITGATPVRRAIERFLKGIRAKY